MSQNLPPDTVMGDASSALGGQGGSSRFIIFICWAMVLMIVGLEGWSNAERAAGSSDAPADNEAMSAIGHCIVGAHVLTALTDKSGQSDPTGPLVAEMDAVAKSPSDRLAVVIISKEVQSLADSDRRLDALSKSTDLPASVRSDLAVLQVIYRDGAGAVSQEQRQSLIDHQKWFGELALTHGMPDASPERSKLLAQAKRAFVVSTSAAAIGGGAVVLGAGLIVLAIVLASTGRLPLLFRQGLPDSTFLEAFAIYLAGFVAISLMLYELVLHRFIRSPGLAGSLLLTVMLPIAVSWPVVRGKPWSQTRMELGWHGGRGVLWEMGCGVVGYIAALPLLAVMLLITLQLIRISGTTPSHPVVQYLSGGPGEIVFIYFLACIWAPIFEESMFRGALFNHLRARHGWWVSAGIVGLLFAAVHPQGWTTIPILGGIGVVLCALREWRSSLIASMAAHALSNGTVITLALLTSR
jgi:membrane protease YdiL (CAAX protease family)